MINDFGSNDTIDVASFTALSETFITGTGLILTDASNATEVLDFSGTASTSDFTFISTGGQTQITIDLPCFAAGTRILTSDGEVPVEHLQVGDSVVTVREGGSLLRKIIWTGQRSVDISSHPGPALVRPVRILAGALAENMPVRDLRLSPHHAVYIDGCLFEATSLVNGITVFQEPHTTYVTYHHISSLNAMTSSWPRVCPARVF